MAQTIVGAITDELGAAQRWENYRDESKGVLLGTRKVVWSAPTSRFRPVQPAGLPLTAGHGGERIGTIQHLEARGRLWVVAEVDHGYDLARYGPWQLSYEAVERRDGIFDLEAVAVVHRSATICMPDIQVRPGSIHMAAYTTPNDGGFLYELLHNAEEATYKRHSGPLEIRGARAPALATYSDSPARSAPTGPVEFRSAAYDVAPGRREIVAMVAPYEAVTAGVMIKGKPCREAFAIGAFDGVAAQRNVVRLNMDHQRERVIGKAVEFVTGRSEGLVATFRVSRTVAGDEALEMARDDLVDCSVGFAVVRDSWPQPDLRVVHEGWLDHVALTSQPAYGSAKVLGVRGNRLLATP